jgi:hypothetical protein
VSATRLPVLIGTLLTLAGASPAQAQVKAVLAKPDAETTESFTQIAAIRELPTGKVFVVDRQDKVVQLVDLTTGTMAKVGREGNGPGEYALPGGLVPLPDGTTLVQDLLNRRFLVLGADGKPGAFLEWPRPPATDGTASRGPLLLGGGLNNARGYDDKGRLYFSGSPFSATGGSLDSVPILRWDRVKPTFDTVTYIKLPANSASSSSSGGSVRITFGNSKRFVPTEAWGVAGDGSIARLIPEPYQVVWVTGKGAPVKGAVVPYAPIKVTEQDKADFIAQQKKNPGVVMRFGGGPGGAGGGGGGGGTVTLPPPEFADTKPPFDGASQASVVVSQDGEVWVLRTRPASDKVPSYDVFDRTGALVKKVSLNPSSRVVGFGKGTVYVVRTDEDDLQYLQRYKRP